MSLDAKITVFFNLKPIFGGGDGGFLKYLCYSIELEFVGRKNVIIPFKYINTSNAHHTVDSLYLKLARASSYRVLERREVWQRSPASTSGYCESS